MADGHALIIILTVLGASLALMAGIGAYIAREKNRDPVEGAMLGFLLGPLGLLIGVLLPTKAPRRKSRKSGLGNSGVSPIEDAEARQFLGQAEGRPYDDGADFLAQIARGLDPPAEEPPIRVVKGPRPRP